MAVNFEIPTETISVGQGSFTVRGLNSEDVTHLVTAYYEDLAKIVDRFGKKATDGQVQSSQVVELALDMAAHFPMLVAEIISRAADAEGEIDKFRQLSFVKQIEALRAISRLSVEDGRELKKWAEGLASLLETGNVQLGPLAKSLQTIIRTHGSTSAT
jgi:ABC-type antimicrobial peptide transport system ATPase subunit